jgi:hypothetical protein
MVSLAFFFAQKAIAAHNAGVKVKLVSARTILLLVAWTVHTCATAHASTLIVDCNSSVAADDNPGTESQPVKTVQHAVNLVKPGDTVFIMAGRYHERVSVKSSGADGRLITLRALPRQSVVVEGFDIQASYVRVEGFEITADKPAVAVQLGGSHCEIEENYIHDMMVGVAGTDGRPAADNNTRDYSAVAHNRIAYNKVYHSEYGFVLGGNDWLVENNEVDRLFMFSPGNKYDDCDYSRFFGKGCVERYNYFHGSTSSEIRVAHVDCLQTFTVNGEIAQDLRFEFNTCFDFHQMCMVESAPHIGSVRGWTFRGNIVSANSPTMSGGWGPDIIQTPDVLTVSNTISTVRWSTIGLRGKESLNGQIRNNILCNAERAVVDGDQDFSASRPTIEHNLTFSTAPVSGERNIQGKDPLFVDATQRNFRLRPGSPAIAAGENGVTIGALDYPNIYYVDPHHPSARDEPGWGYPAVPLASLSRACAQAKRGETVVLRGGVYREPLRPESDGVTFRAMQGEKVVISGADLIKDWRRESDGHWSAQLSSKPKIVLCDGQRWHGFTYDPAARRIASMNGDPRLHLIEVVVRKKAVDLRRKRDVKLDGIEVVNTLP